MSAPPINYAEWQAQQAATRAMSSGVIALETAMQDHADHAFDFLSLLEIIGEVLRDGQVTMSDFEPIVSYSEFLFDKHVVPFDIPRIGPRFENFVKGLARDSIRVLLQKLFDRYVVKDGLN